MAQFISVATGIAATPNVILGTANLCGTLATSTTAVVATGGKTYTFTAAGAGQGTALLAAINTAILTIAGPTCVPVTVPSTVTINGVAIA